MYKVALTSALILSLVATAGASHLSFDFTLPYRFPSETEESYINRLASALDTQVQKQRPGFSGYRTIMSYAIRVIREPDVGAMTLRQIDDLVVQAMVQAGFFFYGEGQIRQNGTSKSGLFDDLIISTMPLITTPAPTFRSGDILLHTNPL